MDRVLEPELMEDEAQALAYAKADFDAPNRSFVDGLAARFSDLPDRIHVVDLGCGPADILVRLARLHPGWRFDGIDGSPAMLHHGQVAVASLGLEDRVRLHTSRVPALPADLAAAELVLSNSLLHHLPDPSALWETLLRVAAPGAAIYIVDLRRPTSMSAAAALVQQWSGDEPEILQRDFLASLAAAFEVDEVEAQLSRVGLSGLVVEVISDRHLRVTGRLPG
jgi:SAM-dependent methyltransferase